MNNPNTYTANVDVYSTQLITTTSGPMLLLDAHEADAGWATSHNAAAIHPNGKEQPIVDALRAFKELCRQHYGDLFVFQSVLVPMADSLLHLLNVDLGRLDGGSCDSFIRAHLSRCADAVGAKLE